MGLRSISVRPEGALWAAVVTLLFWSSLAIAAEPAPGPDLALVRRGSAGAMNGVPGSPGDSPTSGSTFLISGVRPPRSGTYALRVEDTSMPELAIGSFTVIDGGFRDELALQTHVWLVGGTSVEASVHWSTLGLTLEATDRSDAAAACVWRPAPIVTRAPIEVGAAYTVDADCEAAGHPDPPIRLSEEVSVASPDAVTIGADAPRDAVRLVRLTTRTIVGPTGVTVERTDRTDWFVPELGLVARSEISGTRQVAGSPPQPFERIEQLASATPS